MIRLIKRVEFILFYFEIDNMLDSVIDKDLLSEVNREKMREALLLKHVHQHEKEFQKHMDSGEKKTLPIIKSFSDMSKKLSHADFKETVATEKGNG
jgi:hypothetical protein